jgi:hypothetical protein
MPDSGLSEDIRILESLSKVYALALALLYFSGFLVVTFNLSRHGVSSFDALHLQYLIAGVWALGPPVLLALLYQVRLRFETRAAPETAGRLEVPFRHRHIVCRRSFGHFLWLACGDSACFPTSDMGYKHRIFSLLPRDVDVRTMFLGFTSSDNRKRNGLEEQESCCAFVLVRAICLSALVHPLVLGPHISTDSVLSGRRETANYRIY